MCNPLVAAGLAVASAAGGVVAQIQQSKAMARQINEQSAIRATEIQDQAEAEMFDRSVEMFNRIGQQRVAGAQRGLNDASRTMQMASDAILFDYEFDTARIQKNAANAQRARITDTKSRLASASRPTLLGAGLQIAAAGASAYNAAGGFKKAD